MRWRRCRRDLQLALERAEEGRVEAAAERSEQERKLREERETVRARIEALAPGNHLAQRVLEAFTERYGER